jgi:hypothetical protein
MSNYLELRDETKKYLKDRSEEQLIDRVKDILALLYVAIAEEINERKTEGSSESQQGQSPEEQIHSGRGEGI